jgi:succinate dehydrogenase / fumarate reductase membrane anchor subunit
MARTPSFRTSGGSGALSWLFQRITGLVLVFLVIFHFFLMHLTAERGHTYKGVLEALTDPVWGPWMKALDLTMLTLALWHGLNGMWNVVRDFKLRLFWSMSALAVLVTLGMAFWFVGVSIVLAF